MLGMPDSRAGDMKIPTFYATESEGDQDPVLILLCIPIVGVAFGGIHCAGWFFDYPSSAEAMLWRVSSAVLTGIAFLFPILLFFLAIIFQRNTALIAGFTPILLVYAVETALVATIFK